MSRFLARAAEARFGSSMSPSGVINSFSSRRVVSVPRRNMAGHGHEAHGHGHHAPKPLTAEETAALTRIRTLESANTNNAYYIAISAAAAAIAFVETLGGMANNFVETKAQQTECKKLESTYAAEFEAAERARVAAAAAAEESRVLEAIRLEALKSKEAARAKAAEVAEQLRVHYEEFEKRVRPPVVAAAEEAAEEVLAKAAAVKTAIEDAAATKPVIIASALEAPNRNNSSVIASLPAAVAAAVSDSLDDETEDLADAAEEAAVAADAAAAAQATGSNVFVAPSSASDLAIFTGNGNPMLARDVCSALGTQLGRSTVTSYADGEIGVRFIDNVRGRDCYVIQSLCGPNTQDQIMELLLMISSLRRASAERIVAVIPYFAYARQLDPLTYGRTHIPAADIARMMEAAGVDHVVALDLHRPQLIGFFEDTPVENLDTQSSVLPYLLESKNFTKRPVTVVAPVGGTVRRALKFRNALARKGVDAAMAFSYLTSDQGKVVSTSEKQHHAPLDIAADNVEVVGDIAGRDIIIVDDMVDSASRICAVSRALKAGGAKSVYAYATHGLLTGDAVERIEASPLKEVVVFDTVPVPMHKQGSGVRQLSSAGLIAETIRRLHNNQSTSDLAHAYAEYSD